MQLGSFICIKCSAFGFVDMLNMLNILWLALFCRLLCIDRFKQNHKKVLFCSESVYAKSYCYWLTADLTQLTSQAGWLGGQTVRTALGLAAITPHYCTAAAVVAYYAGLRHLKLIWINYTWKLVEVKILQCLNCDKIKHFNNFRENVQNSSQALQA